MTYENNSQTADRVDIGTGPITHVHENNHIRDLGCIINTRLEGKSRTAEASGTVSDGTTNFTPEPYEVSDRSFGLISRLGYYQYLADYLAQEIVQALKNLYNIQGLTGGNPPISGQQIGKSNLIVCETVQ